MTRMPRDPQESNLPSNLGQTAQRALSGAGYSRLEHLTKVCEKNIRQLHGLGPNALAQLRRALAKKGLSFAENKNLKE